MGKVKAPSAPRTGRHVACGVVERVYQSLKEAQLGHLGIGAKNFGDQLAHERLAFCQFDNIRVAHFFEVTELSALLHI